MKLFVDTNVILDWILAREHAFGVEARQIIQQAEQGKLELYMSGGSVYTLVYVLEKSGLKDEELRNTLLRILKLVPVLSDSSKNYENACLGSFKDLEDAFQYQLALSNPKLNFFITGNTKDFLPFMKEVLPVLNPKEFLNLLK
jgi:predicted nucleic acid-binding protein